MNISQDLLNSNISPEYNSQEVTDALVDLIVSDNLPINIVESPRLIKLLKLLRYTPPKSKSIKDLINQRAVKKREDLKKQLDTAIHISFTTDSWTNSMQDNFTSFTVHFIDEQFKFKSYLYDLVPTNEAHTRDNILETINETIGFNSPNNLLPKTFSVTTDNARNIVSAMREIENDIIHIRLRCFSHTLQLVVTDCIKLDKPKSVEELSIELSNVVTNEAATEATTEGPKKKQKIKPSTKATATATKNRQVNTSNRGSVEDLSMQLELNNSVGDIHSSSVVNSKITITQPKEINLTSALRKIKKTQTN
ncbi:hypothetical protein PPL_04646 [Heterostelium album PN500]|uniref:Uncharacterized protein n=1 Tax=Heterostelium pallidum (strain ATCC 26659 / Pp 5 / PN500) TaxID=670386 RepID=D3B855_HETP5|nr:hypothetical protein PPL_04646 [Heterostelium album PN500]EFA82223.1 hypothetical protein PPL_04646 [Heterostelium album PN500]|eukprot:XP_020434340.1 hypothetical protein PPL_04646 [Heterostelium album PN500]